MTSTSATAEVAAATDTGEIPDLVNRLRATFDLGRTRPIEWRLAQLDRLRSAVIEHRDAIVGALAADLGRPALESWVADIGFTIAEIDHLKRARRWSRSRRVRTPLTSRPARSEIVPEPVGVVLVIAPWNYPIQLLLAPLAGAIAAGNAVLIKPSELAPHTSALIARLVEEYLDGDAVTVVQGGVEETTELLRQRFDHIFYTGNGRVGRIVMRAAAENLTPVTLELGGKSPTVVHRSAKLDLAARRIVSAKFVNAGQTCIAPDYVVVDRSVHDEFVERLLRTITEFYGDDPSMSADFGRIATDRHVNRLEGLLTSGRVVVGGDIDRSQRYVAPTVLVDVEPDAPVMEEEIFGPILPVIALDDVDEMIAFVNDRPKPLALYVFAEDDQVVDRIVSRTSAGGLTVNAALFHVANPHLPFGGVGESGMGAYHGRYSFDVFTHHKPVLHRSTRFDPALLYPPYTARKLKLLRRLFRASDRGR